jgi:hypothetical protein
MFGSLVFVLVFVFEIAPANYDPGSHLGNMLTTFIGRKI